MTLADFIEAYVETLLPFGIAVAYEGTAMAWWEDHNAQ